MKLLLFLLLPLSLSAQTFRWQQTLGTGTYVNFLIATGEKIYASSHYPKAAIYLSTDDGITWHIDTALFPSAKDSAGTLYSIGYESGKHRIYRSHDEGSTWVTVQETSQGVTDIEIDNNGIIYAISPLSNNQDSFAVIQSKDQGEHWQRIFETGGVESRLEHIAIDAKNVIYLCVGGSIAGGILYSTNGFLWQYKVESFPEQSPRKIFTFGEQLFAASSFGLYYAENNFSPFIRIQTEYDIRVNAVAFVDNASFYCATEDRGVHRKGSDGQLHEINDGLRHHNVRTIIKTSKGTILCGTGGGGIYRLEPPSSAHSATNEHPIALSIQNNPSQSGQIRVTCSVDKPAMISLSLYHVTGKLHTEIERSVPLAGDHPIDLDVEGLTNGTYLCVMKVGASSVTRSLIVAR